MTTPRWTANSPEVREALRRLQYELTANAARIAEVLDAVEQECWRSVADDPPPEDVVVQVKNNDGALLIRGDRGLWFLPDRSMYVYYTPRWWRPAPRSVS
jgi:hypothetical protein